MTSPIYSGPTRRWITTATGATAAAAPRPRCSVQACASAGIPRTSIPGVRPVPPGGPRTRRNPPPRHPAWNGWITRLESMTELNPSTAAQPDSPEHAEARIDWPAPGGDPAAGDPAVDALLLRLGDLPELPVAALNEDVAGQASGDTPR